MKESFLHYVWKYKKFDLSNLKTVANESLQIVNAGQYTKLQGPDFFNAQILIDGQKWAGNIEIHLKSSDWYLHNHETDTNYDSVILHVVWEHDVDIYRKNNTPIPVLVLKDLVNSGVISSYEYLAQNKSWIYCENQMTQVPLFVLRNWQERLFFERLENKSTLVQNLLKQVENDWESVLFLMLAKSFGLNTNGEQFLKIAKRISFQIIRKESHDIENIETLFFGFANLLEGEKEDTYFKNLKSKFDFFTTKHQLDTSFKENVSFFKHRPDNFPTIRLSQLANVLNRHHNLFSLIIAAQHVNDLYELFNIGVSSYWKTHYQFDSASPKKEKKLSKAFVDLLIINTILPLKFAYAKTKSEENIENLVDIMVSIKPEVNAIVSKFKVFGISATNAFESQSMLQLKNEYCNKARCLDCAIGKELIQNSNIFTI